MLTTETAQGAKKRPKYVPPTDFRMVSAAEMGFSPRFALKCPEVYAAGVLSLLREPTVAIVGSRKVSADGLARAAKLSRGLAALGVVVVSGLAEGVDRVAHMGAMEGVGRTIAVIGTPLDKAYPAAHAELQRKIYREHLLISPFKIGQRVFPSNFPHRNLVMANIARATVIIEASDTSGTLHQAAACVAAGRPLFIARSVYSTPGVTWPSRFKEAIPLDEVEQVVAEIM